MARLDAQDTKLDEMRVILDELHAAAVKDKSRIEQLQGELRQANQIISSTRNADLRAEG